MPLLVEQILSPDSSLQVRETARRELTDRIGLTGSLFNIGGSSDHLVYAPEPVSGSRTGSPDTLGGFVQVKLVPLSQWLNNAWPALPMTQFALQYTMYSSFNGASSNYDGFGRSASDNNTLYFLIWTPW